MDLVPELFERLVVEFGYRESGGLVFAADQSAAGSRWVTVERVRRHLPGVDAIYFVEDVPIAYFSATGQIDRETVARLHRQVWNDARVPLLFVVDASHVRVYDAWAEPGRDDSDIDSDDRLIDTLVATDDFLTKLPSLHRRYLDSGTYSAGLPGRFEVSNRCDNSLLNNLLATQGRLLDTGLPPEIVHLLLIRSIFLLHLQHRGILGPMLYGQFVAGAKHLSDLYAADRDATYRLFEDLADRFNGDLFPVREQETQVRRDPHLELLARFLKGEEDIKEGQPTLWPLYDFSIIPIQLISSVYESLLHARDPDAARKAGAYYTRYPIVELMVNEVLPWPSPLSPPLRTIPRIADPSCGSGVFLVEAFRRIVAHWRQQHIGRSPRPEDLTDLLTGNIYGTDESSDAVRISAFSLCLALLDEVAAETAWSELRFPRLLSDNGSGRANLTEGNAFPPSGQFDLVLGNPPWRRRTLPTEIGDWCTSMEYPVAGEMAQAFMWLCGELVAPGGRVAILTPTKWLFNREGPDVKFRRAFFSIHQVDAIINLSAFVGGPNRLFSADAPATAVIFRRRNGTGIEPPMGVARTKEAVAVPAILYCTPRPTVDARAPIALLIDAADIKWLPREEAEQRDDVWKAMYVGSWRDLRLVRRLSRRCDSLHDFIVQRRAIGWEAARGFQEPGEIRASRLTTIPFVDAADVCQYSLSDVLSRPAWPRDGFKRIGPTAIYEGPHVLLKEGLPGGRLCAAFVPFACSFKDTITGIHAPEEDANLLRALTAYLNSSLAAYQLFMTTGWGIDRRRVKKGEVLKLLPDQILREPAAVAALATLVNRYGDLRADAISDQVDAIVFDAFDLSRGERVLVSDMLATVVDYVHRGSRSKALLPPTSGQLEDYARAFVSVLGRVLRPAGHALAPVVRLGSSPLCVVSFRITDAGEGTKPVETRNGSALGTLLTRLDDRLRQREGANLYRRRHVRIFDRQTVHIVKPAEFRFWTRSAAYHDADEVTAQTLAGIAHVTR